LFCKIYNIFFCLTDARVSPNMDEKDKTIIH
jgi:hypothetical protein